MVPQFSQEIPHILRKPKFQYHVEESPLLVLYLKSDESILNILKAIHFRFISAYNSSWCKGKAIPLRAWRDPEGSRRLRLPEFKTIGTLNW